MTERKLNILIAPNSLKGSMSAFEFADVVEEAFLKTSPEFNIRKVPVADGGDFTGEVLRRAYNATPVEVDVNDPLGRPLKSGYAMAGNTAIIEMAAASGLKLLSQVELNPMVASSFGTGQLIAAAIENGATDIMLGVGGSATVDGGAGMMQALGFQYYAANGRQIAGNGGNLLQIHTVKRPQRLPEVSVKIITDVDNPLLGTEGAAAVFGPQKGASPSQVDQLEKGLNHWCRLLKKECGKDLGTLKGGGAAGGVAIPLLAYANAEIVPGTDFILSVLNFREHIQWADVVITGEGKIDSQTLNNKAPKGVADAADMAGKIVIAIAGAVDTLAASSFSGGAFSFLPGPVSLEEAMRNSKSYLLDFSAGLAKILMFSLKK